MSIIFSSNWDNQENYVYSINEVCSNHESKRSADEIIRIISDLANLKDHELHIYFMIQSEIKVLKGIHKDCQGIYHLLLEVNQQKYHLNLQKTDYREDKHDRTFIWAIAS